MDNESMLEIVDDLHDAAAAGVAPREFGGTKVTDSIKLTETEWRKKLTPEEYVVLREKGTERAFSGKYVDVDDKGVYRCRGCGLQLFTSAAKFHSGSGWPSFVAPLANTHVLEHPDTSHGMMRTEVTCARCGGHLGHVFEDGPASTGLRYCINSVALQFEPETDA